jgi:hypothetical protein
LAPCSNEAIGNFGCDCTDLYPIAPMPRNWSRLARVDDHGAPGRAGVDHLRQVRVAKLNFAKLNFAKLNFAKLNFAKLNFDRDRDRRNE